MGKAHGQHKTLTVATKPNDVQKREQNSRFAQYKCPEEAKENSPMKHRYSDRIRSSCLIIVLVGITVFGLRVVLVGPAAALGDAVAAAPASQALEARDQQASTQEAVRQLKQQGQYHSLMAAVQKARYSPQPVTQSSSPVKSASYSAANAGNGFRAWFAPEAVQVRPVNAGSGDWEWSVRLTGYGYGDRLQQPAQADPVVDILVGGLATAKGGAR